MVCGLIILERAKRFEAYCEHFDASDTSGQLPSKACFCPLQRIHCKCVTEMDIVDVRTTPEHPETILTIHKSTTTTEPEQNLEDMAGEETECSRPVKSGKAGEEDQKLAMLCERWHNLSEETRDYILLIAIHGHPNRVKPDWNE